MKVFLFGQVELSIKENPASQAVNFFAGIEHRKAVTAISSLVYSRHDFRDSP
jgi:hypothetical protein